jgi:hypothetical protein
MCQMGILIVSLSNVYMGVTLCLWETFSEEIQVSLLRAWISHNRTLIPRNCPMALDYEKYI